MKSTPSSRNIEVVKSPPPPTTSLRWLRWCFLWIVGRLLKNIEVASLALAGQMLEREHQRCCASSLSHIWYQRRPFLHSAVIDAPSNCRRYALYSEYIWREKWHFSQDHMCCTCGSSLWALSYRALKGPLRRPARRHPPFLNIQSQSFLENLKIFHTWQTSKGAVDMVFRIQLQLERSVFERWLWWPEKLNNPQSKAPPIWEFALA